MRDHECNSFCRHLYLPAPHTSYMSLEYEYMSLECQYISLECQYMRLEYEHMRLRYECMSLEYDFASDAGGCRRCRRRSRASTPASVSYGNPLS